MRHKLRADAQIDAKIALLAIGVNICFCCGGSSAPAAPDYSSVAASNTQSAQLAADSAANQLAFNKQVYSDQQPYIKNLEDSATKTANQQYDIAADNKSHGDQLFQQYQDTYVPEQQKVISDANNWDSSQRKEQVAGQAEDAVNTQAAGQMQAANQRLMAMGVNPSSGKFGALQTEGAVQTAAAAAGAGNEATRQVDQQAVALRAGAANMGSGQPNNAVSAFGTSVAAGNSSTGNLSTAANAPLAGANLVSQGYGTGVQAGQVGVSAANGMGNILNQGYGMQLNANATQNAGLGSLIGGLGTAAGYMLLA